MNAKQMAMSRALGAAFLSHQVEQLEKTVVARGAGSRGRGGVSGNWRDRRQQGANGGGYNKAAAAAVTPPQSPNHQAKRMPNSPPSTNARSVAAAPTAVGGVGAAKKTQQMQLGNDNNFRGRVSPVSRRKSTDEERDGNDADVIVVDASVLVHALYQVKRWCKEGRDEILIVPLEALNTLDLLKKGTSSLAQRARAASRILEAQVGTNPRIRVQQDDAFVYWDKIAFNNNSNNATTTAATVTAAAGGAGSGSDPLSSEVGGKSSPANPTGVSSAPSPLPSPEWVRRTVCCARWEVDNPQITLSADSTSSESNLSPRVVLAVLSPTTTTSFTTATATATSATSQSSSPQTMTVKLHDNAAAATATAITEAGVAVSHSGAGTINTTTATTPIVPLPAPTPGNKFEPRSMGTLVSHWAAKAGIEILEVEASAPGHGRVHLGGGGGRDEDEDARVGKKFHGHGHVGHGGGHGGHGGGGGHGGHGRRKASIGNSGVAGSANNNNNSNGGVVSSNGTLHLASTGLVERPPAVMAMMEMVSQPSSKGKIVRVLARGEKLDP